MLVVSPLVALMKNQVDLLQKREVRAVYAGEAKPCSRFREVKVNTRLCILVQKCF